jgi:prepilin-type N-terminal cleavage/methylation domain-containing protein
MAAAGDDNAMNAPVTVNISRCSRRGFTLMELLVSVTLLSIVMASVYSLTNTALGTWRTVENSFDLQFEMRSFITLFSHEYNNIVGRAAHLIEGDSNSIVMFVIAQPHDLEQGEGPRLMRVEYAYNRSKRSIEREEALVDAALPLPEAEGQAIDPGRIKLDRPYKTTVANNVLRFDLQYIWAPTPAMGLPEEPPIPEPLIYRDRHKDKQGLPQGLEISIELADPEMPEKTYPMIVTLPMRAPSMRLPLHHLEAMFDDAA